MSTVSIDTLLHLSNEKGKTVKLFVSKILTNNSYLVLDEKTHCVLSVTNELKISNGRFIKITGCKNDEKGKIVTTEKSEAFNCSPFKCVHLTTEILSLYCSETTVDDEKLENPVQLKDVDQVPGKV